MINGKKPEPFRSCPFRMNKDILNGCTKNACEWFDKEKQQCIIHTITEAVRGEG